MPQRAPTFNQLHRRKDAATFVPPGRKRVSSARRGYGGRWRRLRLMQLRREPLCRVCLEMGRTEPATDVDHIVPLARGGGNGLENLQSLCHLHHSQKTAQEDGGFGHGR